MYGIAPHWLTRRPVASALVGVAALSLLSVLAREGSARPTMDVAAALSGLARVIDGDTLEIDGRRVRLDGRPWDCGRAAAEALGKLVARRRVTCESRGNDKYGRMLGVCYVDSRDLNAEMVRSGMAWAFVKYSRSYVTEEAAARAGKTGVWQGEAQPAWLYRETRWAGAEQVAPSGCAIKGNITAHGRIYHMPWSPWYGKVKIEEMQGERWFCSEDEAVAAGWRPAATN